jgi:hypothetical protein
VADRRKVNLNNNLSLMLLELRRHFNQCRLCTAAAKGRTYDLLCPWTRMRIVDIAMRWESSITFRLKAKTADNPLVFPCPNLNAHGSAYAMTAEPVVAVAVQGTLF